MSATTHLYNNFKALTREPVVGASAMFLETDIMTWYCIVVGSKDSPYEGVPIRFTLEFPNTYPLDPPKAFFDTHFAYNGGAQMRDEKTGRIGVCLDIFGNFGMVHTEWKNSVGSGWSASYTVSTILITMQCLLSDSSLISTRSEDIERTRQSSFNYKCPITKHDGSSPSTWVPQVFLSAEELDAYRVSKGIVVETRTYNPLVDDYICYITKETKQDGVTLGFGIHIENARIGMLSSTCEYLSDAAFKSGTRQSTLKKPFEHWLPILVNSSDWPTVKPLFVKAVSEISKAVSFANSPQVNAVKVCSSIMNSLVVEIMNARNNVTANDKFINGYFSIYRLLKQYSSENITCLEYVDAQLRNFTTSVGNRNKSKVANLGELLIYLTISDTCNWNTIKQFFLEESDARNVFWYAVGNYNNPAKHPDLINLGTPGRTTKVFAASETSRKLIMYQVEFSRIAKEITLELMDSNFGMAPIEIRDKLKNMYGEIDAVSDWSGYLKWLSLPIVPDAGRNTQLENAVTLSNLQGYTGGSAQGKAPQKKAPYKRY
jgi:ubiquitin-protein ligase